MNIQLKLSGALTGKTPLMHRIAQAREWGAAFTKAVGAPVLSKYVEYQADDTDFNVLRLVVMLEPNVHLTATDLPIIMALTMQLGDGDVYHFTRLQPGYKNGRQAVVELVYEKV